MIWLFINTRVYQDDAREGDDSDIEEINKKISREYRGRLEQAFENLL